MKKIAGLATLMIGLLAHSAPADEPFRIGVWLNHHLMAEGEESIRTFLREAAELGVTEVYPNFWFHGSVAYPGSRFVSQHPNFDFDPIAIVVEESKALGLQVFAWAEYGFFTHFNRTILPEDCGQILIDNPEWMVLSATGEPFLENRSLGVAHFSVNPAHPDARAFIRGIFLEVMELYPEMDGLNLDRIRYQSAAFSYDDFTRAAFVEEHNVDPIEFREVNPQPAEWVAFRERQTLAFVHEFAEEFRALHPTKEINAAVAPPYLNMEKFQRWEIWSQLGLIDVAIPMIYGNMGLVERELRVTRQNIGEQGVFMAGLDLRSVHHDLPGAIRLVKDAGAIGIVIWDDIALRQLGPNFTEALAKVMEGEQPALVITETPDENPDLF